MSLSRWARFRRSSCGCALRPSPRRVSGMVHDTASTPREAAYLAGARAWREVSRELAEALRRERRNAQTVLLPEADAALARFDALNTEEQL